jgi:homeodomain-containing protein
MRDALRTVDALRAALLTRRDLLLECLALRHQLGVLARSDRRFRPSDRLFWLCLRRWWPRWREALVLVQPATVARWHRERVRGCWSRSRRRPGRPCIDAELQGLIRRMATENLLWGAPRIHGELLKLGIAVSERTVSRYLRDRRTAPSQTWRTFLANHRAQLAFTSTVTLSFAPVDDCVDDACEVRLRRAPSLRDGLRARHRWAVVDWPPSTVRASLDWRVAQDPVRHRRRTGSGKDPPKAWGGQSLWLRRRTGRGAVRPESPSDPKADEQSAVIRSLGRWIVLASSESVSVQSSHQRRQRAPRRLRSGGDAPGCI